MVISNQRSRPLKGNEISQEKPRIEQERVGMRRRKPPINQPIAQSAEPSKKIPEASKIEKKVTHLPVTIKEIEAGYLVSPYFKDIYLYLAQNKCYLKLFKTVSTPEKETALLAIPEICTDKIFTLCHSSLFAGHQGVIKTYLKIKAKFFIPNIIHYLQYFIKGCHICHLACNKRPPTRQIRINVNYRPLSR